MVATETNTENITAQAEKIAEVMEKHYVFGRPGTDYAFYEKHDFVGMVTCHSKDVRPGELEVTYGNSNVRLVINTHVVNGVATIKNVKVFSHLKENPSIEYEELNEEIQEVVG